MNRKLVTVKKIALSLVVLILGYINIGIWLTPIANKNNATAINGHFSSIREEVVRGDHSYDIYIKESQEGFKISADNSQCFLHDSFKDDIKYEQPIRIYLNKSMPFFSIRKPMIICLIANGTEYLSFDCANNKIEEEKKQMPLISLVIALLVGYVVYQKEIKKWLKDK